MAVKPYYLTGKNSAVLSVNGEIGNVEITTDSINAQPESPTLTSLANTVWPADVLMATNDSDGLVGINYTNYSRQLLAFSSKEQLIANLGLTPGDCPVTSVNGKVGAVELTAFDVDAAPVNHTHVIEDVEGLQEALDSKLSVGSEIPYSSITGAPNIPDEQLNSDWLATSGKAEILNKPELFSGNYDDLSNKPNLFDGSYNSLSDKPSFSSVATSGSYNDLTDKPSIPASQVNSDWNSISGLSQILNKPTLSTVATSGSYVDLSNKPTIPSAQIQSDWNQTNSSSLDFIKNKPTTVAGYGITDAVTASSLTTTLSGYATTTALTSGLSGKFNVPTGTTSQYLRGDGTLATFPSLFDGTWTSLTGKPTTLAGYGITDGATSTQLATKFNTPSGTTSQYLRGDGSLATFPTIPAAQIQSDWNQTTTTSLDYIKNKPTIPSTTTQITEGTNLYYTDTRVGTYLNNNSYKKVETLQGTTNTSGIYQVTFANTYTVAPHVNPVIINGTAAQVITISNLTTTGCTLTVLQRSSVTLLSVEVLLAATTVVSGATVGVLVVSKG